MLQVKKMEQKFKVSTFLKFWAPLALMQIIMNFEFPAVIAFISRLGNVKENLAIFTVVTSLSLLLEGAIIQMLSAATALSDSWNNYQKLKNFLLVVLALLLVIHIFLPKTGYTVEKILPTIQEKGGTLRLYPHDAEVWLPKFSTEYCTEDKLIPILQAKGMVLPFSNAADFSGISASEALKINLVMQRVKIDVNEKGTEFAAVTVIGFEKATSVGAPPKTVIFDADHPFAYMIRETSTDTVLLVGSLSK